ncbi:hypothetical protein C8Q80DRAFT_1201370 [Daedaleopsis nitida]|nr:hypothetical protein C8Q80DRAFT_1201370 [Daedaleopsis nitida]
MQGAAFVGHVLRVCFAVAGMLVRGRSIPRIPGRIDLGHEPLSWRVFMLAHALPVLVVHVRTRDTPTRFNIAFAYPLCSTYFLEKHEWLDATVQRV